MTITDIGRQYICYNFGDASLCCVASGLNWYYTIGGTDYSETGGTAQVVSRLASGLVDSVTMTSPPNGNFTQAQLNTANGQTVTLQDCQTITQHDQPGDPGGQWCFQQCTTWTDESTCEYYGCYWFNGSCHSAAPTCEELNNTTDCTAYGCYWYNGSCHSVAPTCEELNNSIDCLAEGCFWYQNSCHTVDQQPICYWIDAMGGPTGLDITEVFQLLDSYIFQTPPPGYNFIPTVIQVMGVIDYYLGFIPSGNQNTGCNY